MSEKLTITVIVVFKYKKIINSGSRRGVFFIVCVPRAGDINVTRGFVNYQPFRKTPCIRDCDLFDPIFISLVIKLGDKSVGSTERAAERSGRFSSYINVSRRINAILEGKIE